MACYFFFFTPAGANRYHAILFSRAVAMLLLALLSSAAYAQSGGAFSVTTLAGQAGLPGATDATGAAARFYNPSGLVADAKGNVYVADAGTNTIRKVTPSGVVTTFAGAAFDEGGSASNGGFVDGTGAAARFLFGQAIIDLMGSNNLAIDADSNIYVADTLNKAIRKITPAAVVTTLSLRTASGAGFALNSPNAVAVDGSGNLYVADAGLNIICKVAPSGITTVLAGTLGVAGSDDGTGSAVRFTNPSGLAVDGAGTVYVADTNNNTIRRISSSGVVTTFAGSAGTSLRMSAGSSDGVGANARFNVPIGLACDPAGNVYVADRGNHSVRKITPTGVVSTIAGLSGSSGSVDGTGNVARFREPCGMTVDASGNVYVADTKNHTIRRAVVAGSSPTVQITSQPVIQITHVGQAVSFGVVATGSGALSYQWKRNGISIAGATSATYAIAVPALGDDRAYFSALVTSGVVSVTSTAAQLQVYPASVDFPPIIMLTQPVSQTATAAQSVTLSVEATGNPPPSYQWQLAGVNIPGATTADYTIASAKSSDAGLYQVVLSGGGTSLVSNQVTLTVNAASVVPVTFVSQPAAATVEVGQSTTFMAVVSGTTPVTFQWQKDNIDLRGATGATLTLAAVQASDAGTYRLQATNAAGTATSNGAALIVNVPAPTTSTAGRLSNLSILATLTAKETMTMGTVLGGNGTSGTKPILARAAGPSLNLFGIAGFLPNPTLTLNRTGGSPAVVIERAAAWGGGSALSQAFVAVGAFPFSSSSSKDSAIYRTALDAASYTLEVTDPTGGSGTVIAEIYDSTQEAQFTAFTPRLINVSVLKYIAPGTSLTAGFVAAGAKELTVLIRAIGPSLIPLGVGDTLVDPKLELYNNATQAKLFENNDWSSPIAPISSTAAQLAATFTAVGAFPLAGSSTKDAVLLVKLPPGAYSAKVSAADGGGGMAIVEVYEVP